MKKLILASSRRALLVPQVPLHDVTVFGMVNDSVHAEPKLRQYPRGCVRLAKRLCHDENMRIRTVCDRDKLTSHFRPISSTLAGLVRMVRDLHSTIDGRQDTIDRFVASLRNAFLS